MYSIYSQNFLANEALHAKFVGRWAPELDAGHMLSTLAAEV
jgi:hypothetical protein